MLPKLHQIILDICVHIVLTMMFALIIYFKYANLGYVIIFICGGILVDLDHLIDHFLLAKNKFNLMEFLGVQYLNSGKVYLILHSWEINFIILVLGLILKSEWLLILALSLAIHFAVDNLQRKNIFVYFLAYRIIKKFNTKELFPELVSLLPLSRNLS